MTDGLDVETLFEECAPVLIRELATGLSGETEGGLHSEVDLAQCDLKQLC